MGHGVAEGHEVAPGGVDDPPAPGAALDDLLLQELHAVAELLQEGVDVVHHGVDQGVEEEVGTVRPDPAAARPKPLPHQVPAVAGSLLEREDPAVAHEEADLLRVHALAERRHAGHAEQVVRVLLHLGPLVDVHHVLQRQAVQLEHVADGLDGVGVAHAVHVHPEHGPAAPQRRPAAAGRTSTPRTRRCRSPSPG
jgi:hypothetical protein